MRHYRKHNRYLQPGAKDFALTSLIYHTEQPPGYFPDGYNRIIWEKIKENFHKYDWGRVSVIFRNSFYQGGGIFET